jgi:hypothetical protein
MPPMMFIGAPGRNLAYEYRDCCRRIRQLHHTGGATLVCCETIQALATGLPVTSCRTPTRQPCAKVC